MLKSWKRVGAEEGKKSDVWQKRRGFTHDLIFVMGTAKGRKI